MNQLIEAKSRREGQFRLVVVLFTTFFYLSLSACSSGGGSDGGDDSLPQTVATPEISLPSGDYSGNRSVTISSTTSGATIRYTTDGSDPSESVGTIYSDALTVDASQTIKAIATKSGMTASGIAEATYVWHASGSFDTSFGSDGSGKVTIDFGGNQNDVAYAAALDANDKIVVVGYVNNGSDDDFIVARFHNNGTVDSGFGDSGKTITTHSGSYEYANAVAIDSSGRIVVGGNYGSSFALVRYSVAGDLDTTFDSDGADGVDGIVTFSFGSGTQTVKSLVIANNHIIAAGYYNGGATNNDLGLAACDNSGQPLSGFGNGGAGIGTNTIDRPGDDITLAAILDQNGKIVTAGYHDQDFSLTRHNADGTLDTSFAGTGIVDTDFNSSSLDRASAVYTYGDKIIVAGSSNDHFALARYNADGTLDTAFGSGGKVTTTVSSDEEYVSGVVVDSQGRILVAGSANEGKAFAIVRYNSDGSPDTTFDDDGILTFDFGVDGCEANAMFLDNDEKIVLVGMIDKGSDQDFALARIWP